MKDDPAIEDIRKVRKAISDEHGGNARDLVAYYRSLERKYADRLVKETRPRYASE
jgi:hypothetical protein